MNRFVLSATVVLWFGFGFVTVAKADLVDMGDGTIYDTDTGLSWLRDAGMGGLRTWADANNWADGLVLCGFR